MNERIECIITGRVQMVMYRDFAQRKARRLGCTGFVRNNADSSVTVVAEGERAKLEALVEKLRKGPVLSRVDSVEVLWKKAMGEFTEFKIEY